MSRLENEIMKIKSQAIANGASQAKGVSKTGYNPSQLGGNVSGMNGLPTSVKGTYLKGNTANSTSGNTSSASSKKTSSSSGSGSASSSGNGGAYGAYMQLAAAQLAANNQRASERANAIRDMAQNAYNRGMSNLQNAYNTRVQNLADNLNSTRQQLGQAYDSSARNVNQDADRSLKQAYINRMMNERNLNQQLSSQGLSGGATESTLARLYNNYGNSRNSIEGTRADNLNELNNTYNTNLANALQAYNNALTDAESQRMQYANQLENALSNNQIAAEENYQNALNNSNSAYLSALGNALDQMNKYKFTPSEVLNDITLANVIQNAYNNSSNYKNAVNQASANSGVTNTELEQQGNNNYLAALLKSLYNV